MKVLVTGGAGFIGSNLARRLRDDGHEVVVVDDLFLGKIENVPVDTTFINASYEQTDILPKDVDVIFHNGARSSSPMFDPPTEAYKVNVVGTIKLLEYARKNNSRIIFASSSSVYGNSKLPQSEFKPVKPPNFYAQTKYATEHLLMQYAKKYGVHSVALRYFSIYGTNEQHKGKYANLVSQFIWDKLAGRKTLVYGDGTQSRDFVNVKDCVEANIAAAKWLENDEPFGLFNVGTGRNTSSLKLLKMLKQDYELVPMPQSLEADYQYHTKASTTWGKTMLKWQAKVKLKDGIKECMKAYA